MKKPTQKKRASKIIALPAAPQITPDQVNGRIASLESELAALQAAQGADAEAHRNNVAAFQERLGVRLKKYNELTGSVAALRALLA